MTATALFNTSVLGMAAQSNALNAVAQNVANSGTVGYKEASTQFSTVLTSFQGGDDVGGGVTTDNRLAITTQGTPQTTSSATDLAIEGAGFFIVSNSAGQTFLTRSGSFAPDAEGRLVNSAGYYLKGYDVNASSPPSDPNTIPVVTVPYGTQYWTPSTKGSLTTNLPSTATPVAAADLPSGNSSTADTKQKTSLTVYDNEGNAVKLDIYFANTGADSWEVSIFDASQATDGGFPYASGPLSTSTLDFTDGKLTSGGTVSVNVPNGATLDLDLGATTQAGSTFGVSNPTVNGNEASAVTSVSIAKDGTLSYVLGNEQLVPAYKIPLANVASPTNLAALSGNVFAATLESGALYSGTAGTGSFGQIGSKELEGSTVDIATQLSNMIVAQRSFTANSQVFQVASEVLQVLNNLK